MRIQITILFIIFANAPTAKTSTAPTITCPADSFDSYISDHYLEEHRSPDRFGYASTDALFPPTWDDTILPSETHLIISRYWEAEDFGSGLTSSCTQIINITDDTSPRFENGCPSDIPLQACDSPLPSVPVVTANDFGGIDPNPRNNFAISSECGDCNDSDAGINPGASEIFDGNGVDENCDGMCDTEHSTEIDSESSENEEDICPDDCASGGSCQSECETWAADNGYIGPGNPGAPVGTCVCSGNKGKGKGQGKKCQCVAYSEESCD